MIFKRSGRDRTVAASPEEPPSSGQLGRVGLFVAFTAALVALGSDRCEPRLDARDDVTLGASLDAMTARMNQEEKLQFVFDCIALMDAEIRDRAMRAGGIIAEINAFHSIQGMTVGEIRMKAEIVGQVREDEAN